MKVTLPEKVKIGKKELIIYGIIIFICIIAVIIAFYVQFYGRIDFGIALGISKEENVFGTKTEEEIEEFKLGFDQIFDNNVKKLEDVQNKIDDKEKDIVYTKYQKKETKLNSYDLEIHIPCINIKNEIIDKYNEEIDEFSKKAVEVLKSENKNIIYSVDYTANVQNGILSLIIRSNLKEGTNAQRVIIEAFNYDLRNNKEITLEEMIKIEHLEVQNVQNTINDGIKVEQKRVEELKNLGYNIYDRDLENKMYKIENSDIFYVTENTIYIIYPYGNEANTSEKDIIIL